MGKKSEKFDFHLQVRGYELDSYGHVNNAVYLNYTEQARWDLFRRLALLDNIQQSGFKIVIVETNIKYIRQLRLFDEVRIETQMELSTPFLLFHHHLINNTTGKTVAKSTLKGLFLDRDNKAADMPPELLAFFTE